MLVSVAVLFLTVKEPKLAAETRALEAQHPEWDLTEDDGSGNEVLPKPVKRSLAFLLVSIELWYIGYNGVTTWWSTYVGAVMGQGLGGASTCLLIATAGAVVSYIPIGPHRLAHRPQKDHPLRLRPARRDVPDLLLPHHALLDHSSRHVRLLCPRGLCVGGHQRQLAPDGAGDVPRQRHRQIHRLLLHLLHGAQVVTPVLAGTLMRHISYRVLFPYAAIFVGASFVTMCFVRHGDSRAEVKSGLAAFEDMDD